MVFYLSSTLAHPEEKNNLVYFSWDWLCERIKRKGKKDSNKDYEISRGENLREEEEENSSAARGKEQPSYFSWDCLCERIKRRGEKRWKNERDENLKRRRMRWRWRRHRMGRREVLCPLIAARYHLFLSKHLYFVLYHTILYTIYRCKIPPFPLQQTPTRALFSTILWKHK